jgi:Family of unknown function (DUF6527)
MIRYERLQHRFVQHVPTPLESGILYISMEYATAAHSCCCGCGEEVVTPFTPTDWNMTFDGEAVSLWPSIGSWTLACRSHYFIEGGRVIEAYPWSDREIEGERRRDKAAKARYYGATRSIEVVTAAARIDESVQPAPQQGRGSRIGRLVARLWR